MANSYDDESYTTTSYTAEPVVQPFSKGGSGRTMDKG